MIGDPEIDAIRRRQHMGERIAQLRRQAGLTQLGLSQLSDLTPKDIDALENGLVHLPPPVLLTLCRALKVDLLAVFSFGRLKKHLISKSVTQFCADQAGRTNPYPNRSGTSFDLGSSEQSHTFRRDVLN